MYSVKNNKLFCVCREKPICYTTTDNHINSLKHIKNMKKNNIPFKVTLIKNALHCNICDSIYNKSNINLHEKSLCHKNYIMEKAKYEDPEEKEEIVPVLKKNEYACSISEDRINSLYTNDTISDYEKKFLLHMRCTYKNYLTEKQANYIKVLEKYLGIPL